VENRHKPRLLIADDHLLLAEACKGLLEPEFEVVGIVGDGRALVDLAMKLRPDVVILDIAMPRLNGLDAGEKIKRHLHSVKLVYMTMNQAADVAAEAFRRGASGYVLKQAAADELLIALRKVLKGESYLSSLITKDTMNSLRHSGKTVSKKRHITTRQNEVLQLLVEGKSMREIADLLHVRPGTVAFHKYRIMEALGLKTNAELLEYAMGHHMIASNSNTGRSIRGRF
jgi:DNA-binding NarL/FixJ family response regulator